MEILGTPIRPVKWAKVKRVAFIAHALMPDYLSTALIDQRLKELGKNWPGKGENPGFSINWFSFPVRPPAGLRNTEPVWVDFYIIPVLAPDFSKACYNGWAYSWSESVALAAIEEAQRDGAKLMLGWGALTKVATKHGQLFLDNHPELASQVSSTHGDAGTASLVVETLRRADIKPGSRIAILGANGAIGDVLARALPQLQPESILLVGKADRPGELKKRLKLEDLGKRVLDQARIVSPKTGVGIHQDKNTACHDYNSDIVIVATTGMDLTPREIPEGALVLDMTTPAACQPDPDWQRRLVLTAGCGEFTVKRVLSWQFGHIGGKPLLDVGAGGDLVIWGCTGETIARAIFGWEGHLTGTNIPLEDMEWNRIHFKLLGFEPQPPITFNHVLTQSQVESFVRYSRILRRVQYMPPSARGHRMDLVSAVRRGKFSG